MSNWLHESPDEVECYGLDDFESFDKDITDDKHLVERIWDLLDKADIVAFRTKALIVDGLHSVVLYMDYQNRSPYRVVYQN